MKHIAQNVSCQTSVLSYSNKYDNVNPVYSFKTQGNCLQELEFRLYEGEWIYGFSLKNN